MIKVNNLSLSLSGRDILRNINFEVEKNATLVISGPNGSGKSKLLEILAGFENSFNGKVEIDGNSLDSYGSELYDFLGYLSNFGVVNNLSDSIISDLAFPLEMQNTPNEEIKKRLDIIIRDYNLEHLLETEPFNLSGGEKQLVNLCSVIIKNPKILILDNATTMIDKDKTNLLFEKLILSKKITMVMVSNDIRTYSDFDNILFLRNGEIQYFGDTSTFLKEHQNMLKNSVVTF